jgi:hypothetical protein
MKTRELNLRVAQNIKKMQQKMRNIHPSEFTPIQVSVEWKEHNSNILHSTYY